MPGSIKDRINLLLSTLSPGPHCSRVGPLEPLKSALSWYGPQTKRILQEMSVTPLDDIYLWVEMPGYGLAWHKGVPIGDLARAMIELTAVGNAHYYFEPTTAVSRGDHVVDAGACEGAFGLECIHRYGAERVYNFEPDSRMARALALTAERNGLRNRYQVRQAAVGAESGILPFMEPGTDVLLAHIVTDANPAAQSGRLTEVEQLSLDDWAERVKIEKVSYLKIDVEGFDLDTLVGAKELIKRWRPKIAVTTYHDPQHADQIHDFLASLDLGYRTRVKRVVCFNGVSRPVMLHAHC